MAVDHPAPDRPGARSRPVVLIALMLTIICSLPVFLTGALAVQIRGELDFGVAALGIAIAVFKGSGALLAAPLGKILDGVSPSVAMRLAAGITLVVSIGIAVLAQSWWLLCGFLILGGIAHVIAQTSVNSLLTRVVPSGRQGFAFGLKQCALPVGSFIAGLCVPLIALTVGWRAAFVLTGCAAVAVGFAVPPSGDSRLQAKAAGAVNRSSRRTPLLVLASAMFFGMVAASTLSAFTVDAAVAAGLTPATGGLILTAGSGAAVLARLTAGALADRRSGAHLPVVAKMLFGGVAGYLLLALQAPWGFAPGAIIAFGLGWGFNGLFWFAVVRVNQATPGRATGIILPGGLLGGLVGPVVFGWIVEAAGYATAWLFAAIAAAVGGSLIYWGRALLRADVAATE